MSYGGRKTRNSHWMNYFERNILSQDSEDTKFEIKTDKATTGYQVQDEVVLHNILAPEGSSDIPIDAHIAVLVEDDCDVAAFARYSAGGSAVAEIHAAPAATASNYPNHESLRRQTLTSDARLEKDPSLEDEVANHDTLR